MDEQQVLYAKEGKVGIITLNRPDKLNAFTDVMRQQLEDCLDETDRDDDVKVVIFTGAGRGFCAGADLSGGAGRVGTKSPTAEPDTGVRRDGGGRLTLRLFQSKKPMISAVNGAAVGVGATMQLPMDIRIASEKAKFGFVFNRRGLIPEACSSYFLPRVVGINKALEWSLTGRVFPAEEALAAGLVQKVVAPEALMDAAMAMASEIADNTSAISATLTRHLMWRMLGASHPMEAHRLDSQGIAAMLKSADLQEGVNAFLEKRDPDYPMKVSQDMPDFFPWWEEPEFGM